MQLLANTHEPSQFANWIHQYLNIKIIEVGDSSQTLFQCLDFLDKQASLRVEERESIACLNALLFQLTKVAGKRESSRVNQTNYFNQSRLCKLSRVLSHFFEFYALVVRKIIGSESPLVDRLSLKLNQEC